MRTVISTLHLAQLLLAGERSRSADGVKRRLCSGVHEPYLFHGRNTLNKYLRPANLERRWSWVGPAFIDLILHRLHNGGIAVTDDQRRHVVDEIRAYVAVYICNAHSITPDDVRRIRRPVDRITGVAAWEEFGRLGVEGLGLRVLGNVRVYFALKSILNCHRLDPCYNFDYVVRWSVTEYYSVADQLRDRRSCLMCRQLLELRH